MIVNLFRSYKKHATYSNLQVIDYNLDILFQCKTLERPWKNNEKNVSCIPANGVRFVNFDGVSYQAPVHYKMVWEYSPKFKMFLWELYGVQFRSECKIHPANFYKDLEGCIAPGRSITDIDGDGVLDINYSRNSLASLHAVLPTDQNHQMVISHLSY